jgi:hypothetical protein
MKTLLVIAFAVALIGLLTSVVAMFKLIGEKKAKVVKS